jgi:hypothetical protein
MKSMNQKAIRRVYRVTALITLAAILFALFFQINKGRPFRDTNPFGQDPYDAVGSFAFQGALLIGLLTYARALRLRYSAAQMPKTRLILRGNSLVLFAILVTLIADAIAEIVVPFPPSSWGKILLGELVFMFLLVAICVVALAITFGHIQTVTPPADLTPADGIDDLWTLVRVPITRLGAVLPRALADWVERFECDRLFGRIPWLAPRVHPWRFACTLGLVVGAGLVAAQLQEGLPPSLATGLIVAGIFVSAEMGATLIGFALLGGYLGLRPAFKISD